MANIFQIWTDTRSNKDNFIHIFKFDQFYQLKNMSNFINLILLIFIKIFLKSFVYLSKIFGRII